MSFAINCDWCRRFIKQAERKELAEIISRDKEVICSGCEEAKAKISNFRDKLPEKMKAKIERLMKESEDMLREEIQKLARETFDAAHSDSDGKPD